MYKAYDASSRQNVLLKKLKSIFEHDAEVAERFEAEAKLMAKIQHPNVVSILTSGRSESTVYFTAEFIEGLSLADLLRHGPLPPLLAVFILRELAKGLDAAHAKHIFHRDIKPKNILVADSGEVKLTDFGMASILEANEDKELRGTIGYISPELLFDGKPGQASDIFSLGVTFYEMLTGTTAFRGESSSEVFDNTLNYDPIPLLESNPKIAPGLIQICRTALEKDPVQRYESCEKLVTNLDEILRAVKGFNGGQEVEKYVEDPDSYELSVGEQALFYAPQNEDTSQKKPPVRQHVRSRLNWIVAGAALVIFSLAAVMGATKRSPNESTPQNVNPITPAVDSAESDVSLSDSLRLNLSMPPETLTTQAALSSSLIDDTDINGVEQKLPQLAQIASDTIPPVGGVNDLVEPTTTGETEILCTPFCTVYIDNDSIGVAPPGINVVLPAGVHRLELRHPVLPAYSTDISIETGIKDSVKVALRDYVGTIELNVTPWAKVYIDDVFKGDVPPTKSFALKPGEFVLRLEHDLGTWTDTLLVIAREERTYRYNLIDLLK